MLELQQLAEKICAVKNSHKIMLASAIC